MGSVRHRDVPATSHLPQLVPDPVLDGAAQIDPQRPGLFRLEAAEPRERVIQRVLDQVAGVDLAPRAQAGRRPRAQRRSHDPYRANSTHRRPSGCPLAPAPADAPRSWNHGDRCRRRMAERARGQRLVEREYGSCTAAALLGKDHPGCPPGGTRWAGDNAPARLPARGASVRPRLNGACGWHRGMHRARWRLDTSSGRPRQLRRGNRRRGRQQAGGTGAPAPPRAKSHCRDRPARPPEHAQRASSVLSRLFG